MRRIHPLVGDSRYKISQTFARPGGMGAAIAYLYVCPEFVLSEFG